MHICAITHWRAPCFFHLALEIFHLSSKRASSFLFAAALKVHTFTYLTSPLLTGILVACSDIYNHSVTASHFEYMSWSAGFWILHASPRRAKSLWEFLYRFSLRIIARPYASALDLIRSPLGYNLIIPVKSASCFSLGHTFSLRHIAMYFNYT